MKHRVKQLERCNNQRRPFHRTSKRAVAAAIATLVVAGGLTIATPTAAQADTGGYGRLVIDRYWQPKFEFGIPRWVTSNTGTRSVAKGSCSAYLGNALGLKWWLWWAPDLACGWAVDKFWQPYQGMSVCGSIPLKNVWATQLWRC